MNAGSPSWGSSTVSPQLKKHKRPWWLTIIKLKEFVGLPSLKWFSWLYLRIRIKYTTSLLPWPYSIDSTLKKKWPMMTRAIFRWQGYLRSSTWSQRAISLSLHWKSFIVLKKSLNVRRCLMSSSFLLSPTKNNTSIYLTRLGSSTTPFVSSSSSMTTTRQERAPSKLLQTLPPQSPSSPSQP